MNDTKIKVLLVEPEKYPKEIVIDDSLEAMQEVVGGDIEENICPLMMTLQSSVMRKER